MDSIDMTDTDNENNVQVELIFRKDRGVTDYELVKTIWIPDNKDFENDENEGEIEKTTLQPLELAQKCSETSESEIEQLPEDLLNQPLEDEVFEEEVENLEDVQVDLLFRQPTQITFELVYTIPLMEDVVIRDDSNVKVLNLPTEEVPPSEELDNVIEEADFTFTSSGDNEDETITLTTEVVTVLENPNFTSEDTFDDVEEEAFQNAFVKSVDTPSPEDDELQDAPDESTVEQTLKDVVEKLENIQESENSKEANDVLNNQEGPVPEVVKDSSPELPEDVNETPLSTVESAEEVTQISSEKIEDVESPKDIETTILTTTKSSDVIPTEVALNELPEELQDETPLATVESPEEVTQISPQKIDDVTSISASEDVDSPEDVKKAILATTVESSDVVPTEVSLEADGPTVLTSEDVPSPELSNVILKKDVTGKTEYSGPIGSSETPENIEDVNKETKETVDKLDEVKDESHFEDDSFEASVNPPTDTIVENLVADDVISSGEVEERTPEERNEDFTVAQPQDESIDDEKVVEKLVSLVDESLPVDSLSNVSLDGGPTEEKGLEDQSPEDKKEQVLPTSEEAPRIQIEITEDAPLQDHEDHTQEDVSGEFFEAGSTTTEMAIPVVFVVGDSSDSAEDLATPSSGDVPTVPEDVQPAPTSFVSEDVVATELVDQIINSSLAEIEGTREERRDEKSEKEENETSGDVPIKKTSTEVLEATKDDVQNVLEAVADSVEPSKEESVNGESESTEKPSEDVKTSEDVEDSAELMEESKVPQQLSDVPEEAVSKNNRTKLEETAPTVSEVVVSVEMSPSEQTENEESGVVQSETNDQPDRQEVSSFEDVGLLEENTGPAFTSIVEADVAETPLEETFTKEVVTSSESSAPHNITNVHFTIPKVHEDYGNDYVPFGTENIPKEDEGEEEEDVVAELPFQPIRQWKDEDVISLQSLKSLVAEVGCTTETEPIHQESSEQRKKSTEETLKILKVVPSEPSLLELDFSDPNVIHVPVPLLEPTTKYLENMVDWIIADAIKEVGEREVVTESELSEMVHVMEECQVPQPLEDLNLPHEDDEKTPEPEKVLEVKQVEEISETPIESPDSKSNEDVNCTTPEPLEPIQDQSDHVQQVVLESQTAQNDDADGPTPERPPRAPKQESPRVRFGPLNIKLGRTYSEEQKALEEMLEKPLEVITSSRQLKATHEESSEDDDALSPLSPGTLAEYEHIPTMDMQSVPHSPLEKDTIPEVIETKIMSPAKSTEVIDEDGSECLDSIGDLSERTIQRFNTSIDDPSIRRDSFSSISSFGDRQKFRTAIDNIRQDLLPFQSSVSQYLEPSVTPIVANISMDSPSDLSPNAPPAGFENTAQFLEKIQAEDRPSAEGSIDSSGFEKVDHEGLEDYGAPVADPMQQSVFGSLQADADDRKTPQAKDNDDGFVFIERNETTTHSKKMSSPHDDVIEKNYGTGDANAATAALLESPIAEEARKLVQDAVESASVLSKHAVDDADDIGKELLDNVEHKVVEPVTDTLQKAYDGLGDFVHETAPRAVDDFVREHRPEPESPKSESPKFEVKETLPESPKATQSVDIHETVDKVHDEIDSFLRGHQPTPPLEADEENDEAAHPHFVNQTPEEDETTFDRKGPLTIPEEVEKAAAAQKYEDDLADFDPLVASKVGEEFGAAVGEALTEEEIFGHQKFEKVPRPPTPPKDISDESVKPSMVDLGPAHHHSHPSSPHHSILKHHGEPWIDFKTIPPCVLDVIYWRDPKKSAIVLSLALLALFVLAKYPLLTVVTYSLLLSLGAAAGFRVFKKVEAQIKKTDAEHPFSEILASDLSLPQEKVHAQADVFVEHATCAANKLKKLVFVESPFESLKFGLVLWSLTYVASWFSGFTLAILGLLGVFSVPKVYESNQEAIDPHLATISGHLKNVQNLIDEKLPFLRSAPVAAEEKKDQ